MLTLLLHKVSIFHQSKSFHPIQIGLYDLLHTSQHLFSLPPHEFQLLDVLIAHFHENPIQLNQPFSFGSSHIDKVSSIYNARQQLSNLDIKGRRL
jgi:hypothetical protein